MLLFAALLAVVIFAVTRLTSHHGVVSGAAVAPFGPVAPRYGPPDAAMDMEQVRFRYARGEMSRDMFSD